MAVTATRILLATALLSGCGKVTSDQADAGVDADLTGTATVVTQQALYGTTAGARAGDIEIVSNLPNNAVLATGKTDANGNATINVYPGGSVTAIYRHSADMGSDLITWSGVKPGDTLTFGNRNPNFAGANNTLGSQTYTYPTLAAATGYRVQTPCGTTFTANTSVTISEFPSCAIPNNTPILFMATNASGVIINSAVRFATFSNGATITLNSWGTPSNGMVNITGLPTEVSSINGSVRPAIDFKTEYTGGSYSATPTGGAYSLAFPLTQVGSRTVGTLSLFRNGFRSITILDGFSPSTLTHTVASPTLTPWGQANTTVSSALQTATWFVIPDAAAVVDGQLVHVNWSRNIGGNFHSFSWDLIVPPGIDRIQFPAMPATAADRKPLPEDGIGASVRVFDLSTTTNFDMVRALPSSQLMCLECAVRVGEIQRAVFTSI